MTDEAAQEGRYLYGVVTVADEARDGDGHTLDVAGVDGADPRLVVQGSLGAVVHSRSKPYESDDEATVRRWLLQHQGVVDAATAAFGTPIPVRFDTVLDGDDDAVADWLDRAAGTLEPALDRVSGRHEYRVVPTCDADALAAEVDDDSGRLADLRSQREEVGDGTAFMKSRQIDRVEASLVADRWTSLVDEIAAVLTERAARVTELDRTPQTLSGTARRAEADHETTFAMLATAQTADAIGDRLDTVAATAGIQVAYTGPWAPYSFAPDLGGDQ